MKLIESLQQALADAAHNGGSLQVAGHSSKSDWCRGVDGELLVTGDLTGIIQHDPAELVITAYAGTPLRDIAMALKQHDQVLAGDPPVFRGRGTIGGAVAAGFSGPGRPWHGSLRDAVLGVHLINGCGELLQFGGQVMKNVAGYDVSRLNAGAWGALGLLTQVSLRVAPAPHLEQTRRLALSAAEAVTFCRSLARQYLPLSGTWWLDDTLYLRLSGTLAALEAAEAAVGGEVCHEDTLWSDVRDQAHGFFRSAPEQPRSDDTGAAHEMRLWRLIVPPNAPVPDALPGALAIEWGGGLRWWWHHDANSVLTYATACGGWAWSPGQLLPLEPAQSRIMARIQQAFDPRGVLRSPLDFKRGDHAD